jgi:hypothetical protein
MPTPSGAPLHEAPFTPQLPPTMTTTTTTPQIATPLTPVTATAAAHVAAAIPPARIASPQRPAVQPADTGRGRGLATATTDASTQQGSSTTPSSGGVSPSGEGSEGSPAQQPSPPGSNSTGGSGRAALRGGPHQPPPTLRADLIGPMERLGLQEAGGAAPQQREFRIESVLHTRPANCTDKKGTSGTPVQILCNYFRVLNRPDWILYQYHVDFAPVIDSKRTRIELMRAHDALFPQNKAFDGMTLYSLTRLPNEVCFCCFVYLTQ